MKNLLRMVIYQYKLYDIQGVSIAKKRKEMHYFFSCLDFYCYFCIVNLNTTDMNNKEPKFCQSCGMPLSDEILGTNADGSKNDDYCIYCYMDGAFTADFTMEEMAEHCSKFVEEYNNNTGQNLTVAEYKEVLMQFYPTLKRWNLPADKVSHAEHPMKKAFIEEVNALGIPELHIDNLFILQGFFINLAFTINGNDTKLLNDDATYWGNQVQKSDGRCYGIACDEKYILVSEYGPDGTDAELVVMKRR